MGRMRSYGLVFMKRTTSQLAYFAKLAFLAVRYRLGSNDETFWEWCFLDLKRIKEKTGQCNKHQLYFLAADAMDHDSLTSLEKLMYYFHSEIERDFAPAFQSKISNALLQRSGEALNAPPA